MNSSGNDSQEDQSTEEIGTDSLEKPPSVGCLFLIFLPLILLVGGMRWNLPGQLDADFALITTWFCDTVLVFFVLFLASMATDNSLIKVLFHESATGLGCMITVVISIGILAFVVATICAFHYLIGELSAVILGR